MVTEAINYMARCNYSPNAHPKFDVVEPLETIPTFCLPDFSDILEQRTNFFGARNIVRSSDF
jgi:hypothetical protein